MPEIPLRDDGVTTACGVCGTKFVPVGRQRFCKSACRQAAWRERHPAPLPPLPSRAPRLATVYECPECGTRYLGEQRCEQCGVFCRRIGPGGPCPHCDEPVALTDLLESAIPPDPSSTRKQAAQHRLRGQEVVVH